ncbi:MAG: Ig-like domain-containing protein [Gemmatimonadaceae bacterium]
MRLSLRTSALALFLVACSGGGDSASVTPPAAVLSSVVVSAPAQSVVAGQTLQLSAAPKDQNGAAFSATVTWSSSAPALAAVNATSGLVTGVAAGTATITASAVAGTATVTSTLQVTVTAPPPAAVLTSVTILPSTGSLFTGDALALVATPRDQDGAAMAATVTWSTSAPAVATVSTTGGVAALSAGTATITASATAGGVTKAGTVVITVNAAPLALTSVAISGGSSVNVGATLALNASPRDQNGNLMAATVTWTSSAPGFATINATTGVVTGVAAGSTNITATATAGGTTRQGVLAVTVTGAFPLLAAVDATLANSFSPATVDIAAGGAVDFTFATTHNVTFSGGGAPAGIPNTSSGTVRRTFNTAGIFDYSCTLHAGMNGTVIVH